MFTLAPLQRPPFFKPETFFDGSLCMYALSMYFFAIFDLNFSGFLFKITLHGRHTSRTGNTYILAAGFSTDLSRCWPMRIFDHCTYYMYGTTSVQVSNADYNIEGVGLVLCKWADLSMIFKLRRFSVMYHGIIYPGFSMSVSRSVIQLGSMPVKSSFWDQRCTSFSKVTPVKWQLELYL